MPNAASAILTAAEPVRHLPCSRKQEWVSSRESEPTPSPPELKRGSGGRRRELRGQSAAPRALDFGAVPAPDSRSATPSPRALPSHHDQLQSLPVLSHELAGRELRPFGIRQHGQTNVRGVDRWDEHRAAELGCRGGGRVGVVDRECDMPVRLVVVLQRLEHRDDILEPGRTHLSRALAHPRNDASQDSRRSLAASRTPRPRVTASSSRTPRRRTFSPRPGHGCAAC